MRKIFNTIVFLCITLVLTVTSYAQDQDQRSMYDMLFTSFSQITEKKSWNAQWEDNEFLAYRYTKGYQKLDIRITSSTGNMVEHTVTIKHNKTVNEKTFRFTPDDNTPENIQKIILPYLIQAQAEPVAHKPVKTYSFSVFTGVNRFHDTHFFPTQPEGEIVLGFNLVYNPSRFSTLSSQKLGTGDYLSFSAYVCADDQVREHSYDIHYLIKGRGTYASSGENDIHTISGFFMGVEYFRPMMDYQKLTWDEKIFHNHPHIQYFTLRAAAWEYLYQSNSGFLTDFQCMAGCGPSVNSSLNATEISEDDEEDLNFIFKSKYYGDRRQNFYYSFSIPLKIELTLALSNTISVDTMLKSYFFLPIEGENAYDLLNITRVSPVYSFTRSLSSSITWEYWHVHSMLENDHKNHHWNRLMITMNYNII